MNITQLPVGNNVVSVQNAKASKEGIFNLSASQLWQAFSVSSMTLYHENDFKGAETFARRALAQVSKLPDSERKTILFHLSYARLSVIRGQYSEATNHYDTALELCEATSSFDSSLACDVLDVLAEVYYLVGDIEQAVFLYKTAFRIDRLVVSQAQQGSGLFSTPKSTLSNKRLSKLASVLVEMGLYDEARRCLRLRRF